MRDSEKIYEHVFGKTFSDYKMPDLEEFIVPFQVRFERNNLNPKEIFEGKRCLDAGCGNGRGSYFMLRNGAASVDMLDVSTKNVETCKKFAKDLGLQEKIRVQQSTLEEIPFEEGYFDFVWCNGVIMHTERPNKCLAELARVCKIGGQGWLYIYGSGGLYWKIIYRFRDLLKDIDVMQTIQYLKYFRYSPRYVAEFIDDWYAANLRTYTHTDLAKRCESVGFEKPDLLPFGMDYDTSQRLELAVDEKQKQLAGEGDLRYLLNRTSSAGKDENLLCEDEKGSDYLWPESVTTLESNAFSIIPELETSEDWKKVAICARIQRELRILMDRQTPMEEDEFLGIFNDLSEIKNLL
jgi:ubiquinone/menaquinone biosynthesis C-methylase UbiE